MPRDLLLGYDDSDCARAALDTAIELARARGDRLVIAFGYEPPGLGEEQGAHRRALEEVGRRITGEALRRAEQAGVEVDVAVENPSDAGDGRVGRDALARADRRRDERRA